MKIKRLFTTTLMAMLAMVTFAVAAFAQTTVVVTPSNTQGWSKADTKPGGDVNFVPDTTNGGNGALQLTTDSTNAAKAQYIHSADTPLADVEELSYWTKQVSGPAHAAASYQLLVDLCGANSFTTFVYEPYQNNGLNPPSPAIVPNQWQQWDVDAGMFWSSKTVNCPTGSVTAGAGGAPFYSLAQLQATFPDAVVIGFGVNIGTYNPNYKVYADLVNFNGTTYDFEMFEAASNAGQCKNGGWGTLSRADGSPFKNQGDCVSYTNNGK